MIIVDTSALLAFFDQSEGAHQAVSRLLTEAERPLVVSAFVVAELDYLVMTRYGVRAEAKVLDELGSSAWRIELLTTDELVAATDLIRRYADERIGLADASNIILAHRYHTTEIATLDHRHFDHLRLPDNSSVSVVP